MTGEVHIIDYGMGNLRSVQKAFERNGATARICRTPDEAEGAERLVLPGVGAFRDAISELKRLDFIGLIRRHIDADRPFLGICLGLQMLFDVSYEGGEYAGLGIFPGHVARFPSQPGLKVPHMGWNTLAVRHSNALIENLQPGSSVYFVHSYHVVPTDSQIVSTTTEHGTPFTSMVSRGRLFATQFHPEKSQATGLNLLSCFARMKA
jgi:glutamine amidotransferase